MQEDGMIPSEDPGALKVTISKFYRPSGKSTQLEGVKSDVVLPSPSDIKEVGESELLNPLPWDTIAAAKFSPENRVFPYLAALRSHSAERIGRNPDFADLKTEIEHDRKIRADKTISLNEEERRKEKAENDERTKALKAREQAHSGNNPPTWEITLKNYDKPGVGEPVKATAKPVATTEPANAESDEPTFTDYLILGEAQHILSDYIDLIQGAHAAAVTKR
jgi:carboxyl-terminal processing protease